MTAIQFQDMGTWPDVFALGEQLHRPADAPESVRKAWTEYLAEQATAELAFVRTIETLRELVTSMEVTAVATCRRRQTSAYAQYIQAVTAGLNAFMDQAGVQ